MSNRKPLSEKHKARISASVRRRYRTDPEFHEKIRKAALKASQTSKANRDRDRAEVARLQAEVARLRGEQS